MRLASIFVVTFGIGVISYPAINIPYGKAYFADKTKIEKKQKEPAPKREPPGKKISKTEFAFNEKEYRIIINIPATKLTVYEDNNAVMEFPIAVGQAVYKTPVVNDELKEIAWNPWWYPPKSDWAKNEKITPPGPRNPLGPVKMELGDEIRIHGTSKPWSVGSAASHGCIRMYSKDATTLAWYLQSRLTDKNDPALLEKYKKSGSTTFHVKLNKPVPVNLIYKPIAFNEEVLTLYPDIYGKIKDIKEVAAWELYSNGINPWAFDLARIEKPKKGAVEMDLRESFLQKQESN